MGASSIALALCNLRGAVSRAAHIAPMPIMTATVQYHAGASGFPVSLINQVTAYCVVPPNVAMAKAYTIEIPPDRIAFGKDSASQITIVHADSDDKIDSKAVAPSSVQAVRKCEIT